MNSRFTRKNHSIDSLAALLLFAMYVLFLLFLMLFGAGNYQASVKSLDTNNNLSTAASYITTKFRQHDIPGIFLWGSTLHSFRISKLTLWKTLFTESH